MKRKSKTMRWIVVLAMLLSFTAARSAVAQVTWNVDTLEDIVDETDGFLSLREAFETAGTSDTINITVTGTITLDAIAGPLCMGRSVNICGPGQELLTVSGGNAVDVMWTGVDTSYTSDPSAVVAISGLTIADGFAGFESFSGGITNVCTLMLTDCTLTCNTGLLGGALANFFGTVELTGCSFSDNNAIEAESEFGLGLGIGGAIFNWGTLALTDCRLNNNTAARAGGAIYSGTPYGYGEFVELTVNRCVLSGNMVTNSGQFLNWSGGGGAICNAGNGCTATASIEDSVLTGNSSQFGAALLNYAYTDSDGEWWIGPHGAAAASIVRSTLSDNLATTDSTVAFGGAIAQLGLGDSASSATLTVDSSTLSGNYVLSGVIAVAGAICSIGPDNMSMLLRNTTLTGNGVIGPTGVEDAQAGAIGIWGGRLTVDSCTFSGNFCQAQDGSAADGSSGIMNGWGETVIKNTILANDPAGPNLAVMDIGDTIASYGHNLCTDGGSSYLSAEGDQINADPMLGELADNGGPTWTCALLPGSPAIDTASSTDTSGTLVEFDQRGVSRPQGDGNDIGAFEVDQTQTSVLTISDVTVTARNSKVMTVTVLITNPGDTETAYDVTVTAASVDGVDSNSPLPLVYGAIKPGASKKCTLQFKNVPSGDQALTINGTSSLGDFFTTQTVTVP